MKKIKYGRIDVPSKSLKRIKSLDVSCCRGDIALNNPLKDVGSNPKNSYSPCYSSLISKRILSALTKSGLHKMNALVLFDCVAYRMIA